MSNAWILGTASTVFQKWPDRTFRDLAKEVVEGVLSDSGIAGSDVEHIVFANCAMGAHGQDNIRGQVALTALMRDGRLPARVPIVNVEAGCATGSAAFHAAVSAVRAGDVDVALAIGVEKTLVPDDPVRTFQLFSGGIDQRHKHEWRTFFAEQGKRSGMGWTPHKHRILFLDVHAMQARHHMATHGTTAEHLAVIASKNHGNAVHNPRAQYRFEVPVAAALADKEVVEPFTRSMCSPLSDGAAAVLVCSDAFLARCTKQTARRAVQVRASVLVGGTWRNIEDDNVVAHAAARAYDRAGLTPDDIDIAEVHDATSYCELQATELLGFCERGSGGAYAASGATARDGARPVNASGGLISKGHPLGATGLGMIDELVRQLRGEAGALQVSSNVRVGLQQNAGGLIGLDEALCHVGIFEHRA
ncbi:MAG: thiolase [Deltaproteobacteria bacterium]|nr:thiolase [Deltaproteobacteria bacterium]HCH62570.1 thiolase [Deltaproteobacteria bacterium]